MSWPKIKFPIALLATQVTHFDKLLKLRPGGDKQIPVDLSLSYRIAAADHTLTLIPCAVAEERMNLIEFADFLLSWFRGFLHISLTDFFLYHRSLFSISQFSLHNKIILLPNKIGPPQCRVNQEYSDKTRCFLDYCY